MIYKIIIPSVFLNLILLSSLKAEDIRQDLPQEVIKLEEKTFIQSIIINGNKRIESDTILANLPFSKGESITLLQIDEALKGLFATGYFKNVNIYIKGQALIIDVLENPIINRISFEGNSKLKDDVILQEIRLKSREILSTARIQEAQQYILEIYRRMGRFSAKVEPKIITLPENRVDLVFEIYEGTTAYVKAIHFIGNKTFQSKTLESHLLTKKSRWYRFFAVDDVYDTTRLEGDKGAITKFYNNNGYPDAQVVSAVAELNVKKTGFVLTFTIHEGEKYTFDSPEVRSRIAQLDSKALKKAILISKGALFNGSLIENSLKLITQAAGNEGFAFVSVDPKIEKDEEKKAIKMIFTVNPGPRVYIKKIVIVGNDRTRDHVIRRELLFYEGDAYSDIMIKQSENNLKNLGYFKNVKIETEQTLKPDQCQMIVTVEEQPTGELSLAGGYSTLEGPLASVRIVERNFRGSGQVVHADLSIAKKRQDFNIGIVQPYFLNRNLTGSANVFSTRSSHFNGYNNTVKGTELGLGYGLSGYWFQGWTYSLSQSDVSGISPTVSSIIKKQSGKSIRSALTHTLSYDKRNSRIDPSAGYVVSLSNTYSGLGGSVSYLSHTLNASWFTSPLEDVVFNLRGSSGIMQKINKPIRVVDSYMLGAESFRGFEYGGIGPRDGKTSDALGGTKFYTMSAELTFPIGLPNEFGVKGATFIDTGSVWKPGESPEVLNDKNLTRVATGVGLSWSSPLGPIRVDYAFPIRKQKFDKTQRLLIAFSTRF